MNMNPEFYHQPNYHSRVTIKQTHLDIQGFRHFCHPYIIPGRKDSKMHSISENEFMKGEGMNKTN